MDVTTLQAAIKEVCPTTSVTVGHSEDRSQWSFVAAPEATEAEIYSGRNVLATIPIFPDITISTADFIARWTNAEYLALEKKRAADIAANKVGNAKNWDIVTAESTINFNSKKCQSLKADLVTDGVLTQVRADEIFS